jgi:hypothetical protein
MTFQSRGSQAEAVALNHATVALFITNTAAGFYMIMLQYLLMRIRSSASKAKSPTTSEIYCFIAALWILHRILDQMLCSIVDTCVQLLSAEEVMVLYSDFRQKSYNLKYWAAGAKEKRPGWDGTVLLFYEILATWLISQSLIFLLETAIPLFLDIRQDHNRVALRFQTRCLELVDFAQSLDKSSTVKPPMEREKRRDVRPQTGGSNSQTINLERLQTHNLVEDQRTLTWNLTVDKSALDEMKEILGPPGGFGELGFHVAYDRVCFEAMSIGTRFNLTFGLKEGKLGNFKEARHRKSR